jgi:selenocysteine-specific elongation factor
VIVATAGHVDHGKTTLVKALTGVDADRLPEEKRRGLTIDLGFAYAGDIGFVDVPGHERFVHNMLAGVSGIDLALLAVAADDGPMPQTHEHLAIVRLLGVPRLAVALTKIDRVAADRVAEVMAQVSALVPEAPVFRVCALRDDGVEALKSFLGRTAKQTQARSSRGHFRLSVDRAFTLAGAGLIVTGTAISGEIAAGAQVRALLAGMSARVRGIHAHHAPSPRGRAGQRLALNLAGLEGKAPIARGDWIVAGPVPPPVLRFDARLTCVAGPIAHWTPVHLHLGCADVPGRVAHLDGKGLVQLQLEAPIGALHGDRFIVRDASARRTLGGGIVIDVFPPARGRARPERLAWLEGMAIDDDEAALAALLERSPHGLDMARFSACRNLPAARGWRFSARHWSALRDRALANLAAFHARAPDAPGMPEASVLAGTRVAPEATARLIDELIGEGRVMREAQGVRLAAHCAQMSAADATLWKRVRPLLERGGLRPPTVAELAAAAGTQQKQVEAMLGRLSRAGSVVRVSRNRYFLPAAVKRLESMILDSRTITAAQFRDRAGIGRGLAIEVLEFFDRTHLTRRVGDAHVIRERGVQF